jgi:transposase InsO family protein
VQTGVQNSLVKQYTNGGNPKFSTAAADRTDQGSQFTSETFISLLKEFEIKISMDGKGWAIDNIFIERFWRTVKYEHIYLNPANGGYELYEGLEEYMRYYNFERSHSSLEKATPAKQYKVQDTINFLTKYSTIKSTSLV